MALKQAVKDKLKALGLDVDRLEIAIKDAAEVDLDPAAIPDIVPMTQAQLDARDAQMKTEGKTEGETLTRGIIIKEIGSKLNITVKDTARIGDLIGEVQKAINADGNTKTAALQEQVNALTADKEKLTGEVTAERTKASAAQFDSELIAHFPVGRSADLSDSERLGLLKMGLQFENVDGKVIVKRNGTIVSDDKTRAPKAVGDVIKEYFTERKWDVATGKGGGGRGGDDDKANGGGNNGLKKFSAFKADWAEKNPNENPNGHVFMDAVNKHAAANTDFDYNT